jgi:hypothetical protein
MQSQQQRCQKVRNALLWKSLIPQPCSFFLFPHRIALAIITAQLFHTDHSNVWKKLEAGKTVLPILVSKFAKITKITSYLADFSPFLCSKDHLLQQFTLQRIGSCINDAYLCDVTNFGICMGHVNCVQVF